MSSAKKRTKKIEIDRYLVILICVGVVVLIILSLQKQLIHSQPEQQTTPSLMPTDTVEPTIDFSKMDMNLSHWTTYTLPTISLQFKLPPQLSNGAILHEQVIDKNGGAYTGSAYHADFVDNKTVPLEISADSFDFSAGRSAFFSDFIGYGHTSQGYITHYGSGLEYRTVSIPQKSLVGEMTNPYGIAILRVKAVGSIDKSNPFDPLSMGTDTLGALINTSNTTYRGITVTADGHLTQQGFDQILATFKFTH